MYLATYTGEEVTAQFSTQGEDVQLEGLKILGVEVKLRDLPEDLQRAVYDLADGLVFE